MSSPRRTAPADDRSDRARNGNDRQERFPTSSSSSFVSQAARNDGSASATASSSSSANGFKVPKIQRARNPEYRQAQNDDEEEEGAIADPFASSPRRSDAVAPVQGTDPPGPSRPISLPSRPRSPGPSPRKDDVRHESGSSSARRGDGGFMSMSRPIIAERDRYRERERERDREAHDRWNRPASPTYRSTPPTAAADPMGVDRSAHRNDRQREWGRSRTNDDRYVPGRRDEIAHRGRDDEPHRPVSPSRSSSGRQRSRSPSFSSGPPRNSYYPRSPSPSRARVNYYPRSPSPPRHRRARLSRSPSSHRARLTEDNPASRNHAHPSDGQSRWSPRAAQDARGRPDYDPAPLHAARRRSGLPVIPRPTSLDDERPVSRKRSRSLSRSPPPGLLKRKPNFTTHTGVTETSQAGARSWEDAPPTFEPAGRSVTMSAAPSALPTPSVDPDSKLSSRPNSTMHSLENGSGKPGPPSNGVPGAPPHPYSERKLPNEPEETRISKVASVCDALDDPSSTGVRLSCIPHKREGLSGRERRRNRPRPVPLNERKFYGCSSLDDYEITVKLGQGTFGEVKKGRHIATGVEVALKKVTIHDEKDGMPITALREIKLLKKLSHPSIVPVIDMAYRPSGERGKLGDVYMVEPYMDHDLNGMLENPNIRLEHSQIKLYMKQLLEGTLYMHKNRILHRDMKAANLLINNEGQLQIADFGLARPFRDPGQGWKAKGWQGGMNKYTNMVVTRWYRPAELLAGEKKYGPPIDMWGVGCILAEMVTGKPIFKGTSEINQLERIAQLCGSPNEETFPGWSALPGVKDADPNGRPDPNPQIPGRHDFGNYGRSVKSYFRTVVDVGPECADLIDKLLVLDPKKRLTAAEALNHEWFWSKPYPADPSSLPKYNASKEIDRTKRWQPQPAPQQPPPAQQQQQQQQQHFRPQPRPGPPAPQQQGYPPMPPYGGPAPAQQPYGMAPRYPPARPPRGRPYPPPRGYPPAPLHGGRGPEYPPRPPGLGLPARPSFGGPGGMGRPPPNPYS